MINAATLKSSLRRALRCVRSTLVALMNRVSERAFDILSALYMIEEFFVAALELKKLDWGKVFLDIVSVKHPQSVKEMRMLGQFHEASQDSDKAKEIYNELISINPSDFQTIKRLIALHRD